MKTTAEFSRDHNIPIPVNRGSLYMPVERKPKKSTGRWFLNHCKKICHLHQNRMIQPKQEKIKQLLDESS
ncbi:unnamed protein product [Malus baccata var. baccata]